jgi:NTP pyrophosphatase (non-canonical NTP hydrolase)
MEFQQLAQRAMEIRQQYAEYETKRYGRAWTREEIVLGFVGDVGDLAKLVVAQEGVRDIPKADAKLAHELADCLWSVLVLAQMYEINLERTFVETMDQLEEHLRGV